MPSGQYIIDCGMELLEITPDTQTSVVHSFMNLDKFFEEHDKLKTPRIACNDTLSCVYDLTVSLDNWLEHQKEEKIAYILSSNVWDLKTPLDSIIDKITSRLVDSYLKNNNVFPTYGTILDLLNGNDTPILAVRNEKDIFFPANIAAFVMSDLKITSYVNRINDRIKKLMILETPFSAVKEYEFSFEREKKIRELEYHNAVKSGKVNDGYLFEEIKLLSGNSEKLNKKGKKILKKSLNKFSNLFPSERISAFVKGHGFTVEGERFNWLFSKRKETSLINLSHSPLKGHIPYNLTVLTKDDVVLADVCVYVAGDTPIFDQIIAITLFIQHDEEHLLQNCNFFNVREDGYSIFCKEMSNYKGGLSASLMAEGDFIFDPIDEYKVRYESLIKKYEPVIRKEIHKIFGFKEEFMDFLMMDKKHLLVNNKLADFKDVLNFNNETNILISER